MSNEQWKENIIIADDKTELEDERIEEQVKLVILTGIRLNFKDSEQASVYMDKYFSMFTCKPYVHM